MSAAGEGLIRGLLEGCISAGDMGIERRPYHKNCKCALHKDRRSRCAHSAAHKSISYPMRRTWSEGCLAIMANAPPSNSSPTSPLPVSPSGAASGTTITRAQTHLNLCDHDRSRESQ
ncbi:uncharacterized protein LOC127251533 [Andrographis paniculata]|uniref:uncharacterized protein LOC127251533 n=1 Tax=Andrographis paniculata TaxID=175694 RepID=UPI0021E6D78F|nr:uncharacterized protein LOC127251533 [Andrographis paniculata]